MLTGRTPEVDDIGTAYGTDPRSIQVPELMIRRENRRSPAAVSDAELGIAVLLLLIVVVLTVAFVPAFV